jgi:G3E family GTPase
MFGAAQTTRHPVTRKQISLADQVILTKADLTAGPSIVDLRATVRALNPGAQIHVGAPDAGSLFPECFLDPGAAEAPRRSGFMADDATVDHLGGVASIALRADEPLHWRAFDGWLRGIRIAHAEDLLRVKGFLRIAGTSGPVVVQGIHHVINAPVELDGWPGPERQSRLVMIAGPATIEAVRASWAAALPGLIAH